MQQEAGLTSSGQLFLLYAPKAQKQLYQISAAVHPHSALTPLECFVVVVVVFSVFFFFKSFCWNSNAHTLSHWLQAASILWVYAHVNNSRLKARVQREGALNANSASSHLSLAEWSCNYIGQQHLSRD